MESKPCLNVWIILVLQHTTRILESGKCRMMYIRFSLCEKGCGFQLEYDSNIKLMIVVLDGKRKEADKGDVDVKEASKPKKSPDQDTLESDDNEKKSFDYSLAEKPQVMKQK
ncbi:hypothetical protein HanHA300_Chr03g0098801 [Helianthus annuus]|nr:hypothetical protein HanHA300_Chr03g0098801 [Helianthus annuus]